jgi:hypothetical protein
VPVLAEILSDLDVPAVMRATGIRRPDASESRMAAITTDLIEAVRNTDLLEPAMTSRRYLISGFTESGITLGGGVTLHGEALRECCAEALELAVMVCTIGGGLEQKVDDFFADAEPLRSLILDTIGNLALESVVSQGCAQIRREVLPAGYQSGGPVFPGEAGFPITEQPQLLSLADAAWTGISLTHGGMMLPRKSLSMVIGIGPEMKSGVTAHSCDRCQQRGRCHHQVLA